MRLLSVIEEPLVVERILRHLGLSELACHGLIPEP
jgi:hypothetical protein